MKRSDYEACIADIKDIARLSYNWNGYKASPIPQDICEVAMTLMKVLSHRPDIFATARKTIQLEWQTNDTYLEIELYHDHFHVLKVKGGQAKNAVFPINSIKTIKELVYDTISA